MSGMDDWQRATNERMSKIDPRALEAAAAALLVLVERGIPSDTQELLINGSKRQGIAPGALAAALSAAIGVYQRL